MTDDVEFKRGLAEARHTIFQAGMNGMQALTGVAVDALATLMGRHTPASVRLCAARTVAELGIHQHDTDTLVRKLEEIEAYQRARPGGGKYC